MDTQTGSGEQGFQGNQKFQGFIVLKVLSGCTFVSNFCFEMYNILLKVIGRAKSHANYTNYWSSSF